MNNSANEKQLVDRILELGGALTKVIETGDQPLAVIPCGCKVESLENYFPPKRIKQTVTMLEASSFIEYVNRFKNPDTLIFANVSETGASFVAVLDYHHAEVKATPETIAVKSSPDYCDHESRFTLIPTPEWKVWMEANRRKMNQVDFATWLEDNLQLFTDPKGADLLELIQTLSGKHDVRFNSAVRLKSGANKLNFDEDVELRGQSTTNEGAVELPNILTAGLAPFQGAARYEIKARLKYRIESRKLSLWFETIGINVIVRDSIMIIVKQIADETKIVPLLGNP